MKLSDDFSLWEAEKSQTALRMGIDNSVPTSLIPSLKNFAVNILQPVRNHFGVGYSPQSWYRGEALEKMLCWGGNNNTSSFAKWCARRGLPVTDESWDEYFSKKQHSRAEAGDIEVPGVSNFKLAEFIVEKLDFDQLILEHYVDGVPHSGWVHCSSKLTGTNRKEVLRFDGRTYRSGLIEGT